MTERDTEAIFVHLTYIRGTVDGINTRLDALNGRTRATEQAVAVLEDRADEGRSAGRKWGLTAGAIGTAIAAALAYLFGGTK